MSKKKKTDLHILVVDDDRHVRDALTRLLRHHGIQASTSVDGARALARLRAGEKFDCIVADLLMPGMGGREFVEILSQEKLYPLSHVLILTAVHNADNATAYIQYGCAGYCGKPYENRHLLEQIFRACGILDKNEQLEALI